MGLKIFVGRNGSGKTKHLLDSVSDKGIQVSGHDIEYLITKRFSEDELRPVIERVLDHRFETHNYASVHVSASIFGHKLKSPFSIENLGHDLHPIAQQRLMKEIYRILEENKNIEYYASTYSPYLLDEVSADDIYVCRWDGGPLTKKMTDHPEWKRWQKTMSPGEFWSAVGESWVS